MTKISRSPRRHSFSRESYIKTQKENDRPVDEGYLDLFDQIAKDHLNKFNEVESRKNNLEYDLLTTDWILEKVRISESYSQNLYAAMCNNSFQKLDVMPILKEEYWSCSWRYAGGIIADMREEGDYIDWYCSGIQGRDDSVLEEYSVDELKRLEITRQFVGEGVVTDEIRADLKKLGWVVYEEE